MSRAYERKDVSTLQLIEYHQQGMSMAAIARKVGMTKQAVDQRFEAAGYDYERIQKPKPPNKPKKANEDDLQKKVVAYIKANYPDVLFDANSKNIKLSIRTGALMKAMGKKRAWPDLFIAKPKGGYHGLFLELKIEGTTIYTRKGELVANKHIQEQAEVLAQLNDEGYMAEFAVGYDHAKTIIEGYMKL